MRKALVLILAAVFVLTMASVAYAADPSNAEDTPFTFIETPANTPPGGEYNANIPTDVAPAPDAVPGTAASGASYWTYKDTSDASAKYEGSYRAFQNATNNLYDFDATGRDLGPHGGYGTSTNKCKVCHAVHRADGTFMLMRTDTPDDACNYCHIGDHRHSVVSAYWQAGGNIRPANGHTIGAGKTIPDSSVWQWIEDKTLTSVSDNEPGSQTISVRRYDAQKNKIMRTTTSHGVFERVGPEYLRCQSCHQQHNAANLIWKPYKSDGTVWSNGYKLLRLSPSGGVGIEAGYTLANGALDRTLINASQAVAPRAYSRINFTEAPASKTGADWRLKAVDSTYTNEGMFYGYLVDNTLGFGSPNTTGYTRYLNPNITTPIGGGRVDYGRVEEVTLAPWCADCHNLNIAGKEEVETNWGSGGTNETMLTDRSHVAPMAYGTMPGTMGSQCYSCHNNDMPRIKTAGTYTVQGVTLAFSSADVRCGACHIAPGMYRKYKQTYRTFQGVAGGDSLSDFPHAGPTSTGFKLLNGVNGLGFTGAEATLKSAFVPGTDDMDKFCRICHGATGREIGVDK